jgi:hypothetical protein
MFTCCTGDGTAASDEGAGGAPTRAAGVLEGTVLVAAFEQLLLLFLFVLLLLTLLLWKVMLIYNVNFAWLL